MDNTEIARLFGEIADLMEFNGENAFKIRAYQRAQRVIENLSEPLSVFYERGALEDIEGIGKGIAEKIVEALENGSISLHRELASQLPEGILDLLDVPSLGPKKAKLVYEELGVTTIASLKEAAEAGKLESLPGMGKKSQEKILRGIENLAQTTGRKTLGAALPYALEILERVRGVKGVLRAEIAGSLRRGRETVGDVDILAAAEDAEPVMQEFLATPNVADILAQGITKSSVALKHGLQVDLRVVPQESFGAALQYFTGSKEHNVKLRERAVKQGLKINEYGVFLADSEEAVAGVNEEDIYRSVGLAWIPPELREGMDELELAESNTLPKLIEREHILAALHNHTTESDGRMSLEELAQEAKARGYRYFAVTDHSVSLGVARGLTLDRLKRQIDRVREFNDQSKDIQALAGSEVDIRADGSLDYDDELLEQLDWVIAAIHSSLEQPKEKMTERVLNALRNPHVDLLAHPTGRLIERRPPIALDLEALYATAVETGTALEINAQDMRLDLNDQRIREAKAYGVVFSINTDTHARTDFDHLDYGLRTARRGRLGPDDVLNCLTLSALKKWRNKRKK